EQWLTSVMAETPAVQTFRRRVHEQRIGKFRELDERQFAISRDRIYDRIVSTFPPRDEIARARSERGILLHEMEKRRQIKPLRKLFHEIPDLLLTLKPCLMMSPLSVAYFLNAEDYHFDMVIFDEASQIFPQDAVGAIFRADQVIIAGDTKQLPPTDFFRAGTGGRGDFDTDDEEWEEVCDSILEEAAGVLPGRTLRWHYRSRHEHLIAFSNQEIYQGQLVTFPGCREQEPDTGVEFCYVEEGVYESGGRNCNIPEAKRSGQLVREHSENHPDRSLGIIAFSEKQQSAIALEIRKFREQNPQYEAFFAEGGEEEFFIKNLENVQGDERDTILFSICYARTQAQKASGRPMSMRFGPLGMPGGERRLNVAVTRARHNIKVVSSIKPEDIDLTRTDAEGIRMLRSYLAFAMSGGFAAVNGKEAGNADDFADTVAQFLTERGYSVRQSVGCSGYRLDIAVEHPDDPDEYIAAVECDGMTYRAARTARDRDRLRMSALSRMGWNLYRVWSMEWYRNPDEEGRRLVEFLEEAIRESNERRKAVTDNPPEQNGECDRNQ
ncbi:MAG: type III restriction endonuclease subunit R, partial [Mogibacterium sp.]|nr:type III restriction endonuclease subunit R [Mogibacterium sp.]